MLHMLRTSQMAHTTFCTPVSNIVYHQTHCYANVSAKSSIFILLAIIIKRDGNILTRTDKWFKLPK